MSIVSAHGRPAGLLSFVVAAFGTALCCALQSRPKPSTFMTPTSDGTAMGGTTAKWGGQSTVFDVPGPGPAASATYIFTSSCQNGYTNFYAEAVTSLNAIIPHYSGWVPGPVSSWTWGVRGDLCEVYGLHRMSKSGVDISEYADTHIAGCFSEGTS